jgi:non-ribosomal peptide synthetase component F
MPSQQQHIKMALSIDASGIVKRLPKHSTVYDTDYLSDDEKKDGGSSSLYNIPKSNSSPLLAEQRPSNHQTADVQDDSFSSMNSDELVQQIQKVVGGTPFASNLDNSINTISSHRDRNCFQVDDTSFSSIDGMHDNSATLLVAKSPSDLTPSASFWCHKLLSPEDLGELPVLNLPKDLMVDSAHTNSVQQKQQKLSSSHDTLPHLSNHQNHAHPSQRLELLLSQDNLDNDILAAAKKLQTTPMILYLSAFEILLKRWTGEDDFVLGLTTTVKKSNIDDSNKATTGLPNASPPSRHVNFASARITNTLPIRLKGATADRPVIELIQLRDAFWREASSSHMQCSPNSRYNTISEEIECNILDEKRNVALFQVLLDYVDNSSAAGSYHAKWAPAPCTERHPLRVSVLPHEGKMILQFSTTLWTTYLANVFLQNFETLLHSLVQCVQQANSTTTTMTTTPMCSTIRILPDKQLEFLRRECYGPIEIWPEKPLMHQWFEQAADDNPNGIALKIMQQEMTYREVETRSNKLARYLVENLGVEVEDIVAILMPRGFDQIIALLAVLKAGAAYVPCDMTYPKNRIETIMDDAGSFVCLTVSTGMETAGTRGVDIHQKRELIDAKEGSRLNTMVYLDNLAYVLYTSGSTGKPKGVEIEHNTVANYGNIVRKRFGIKEDWRKRKTPDRILMTARISWDASLESLMLAFTNRSTLCLIPSEFEETLVQNIELIATEMRVTRMSCAPGFSQWMDPDRLKHIQLLIFGGDVLTPTTAEAWQNGNVTTLNSYGPTEATCCITDNLGIENAFPGLTSVPLGKPYDNTVTLILDKNRQLCPPGGT